MEGSIGYEGLFPRDEWDSIDFARWDDAGGDGARDPSTELGLDLGDIVVLLLSGTLTGLRDRLRKDGFERASDLVNELARRCDAYLRGVGE